MQRMNYFIFIGDLFHIPVMILGPPEKLPPLGGTSSKLRLPGGALPPHFHEILSMVEVSVES
jgi:hypothetical protein